MVEDALREGSSRSGGSEGLGESEGLSDGKVGLHVDERGSGNRLFSDNDTSSGGEALVDSTDSFFRALDLDEEDRLLESGGSNELRGVEDSSGSGDELTTTSVDSISMEGNILDVESDTSHVLFDEDTFLGGPVEGGFHGVLNFVKVLDSLGGINKDVRSGGLGSETPDLESIIGVPLVFVSEDGSSDLRVLLGLDLTVFDGLGKFVTERLTDSEDSVMLVRGLGETLLAGFLSDGFLVGDDGVTLLDGAFGEFFLKILRQISIWSSPHPAITCSPDSSVWTRTRGSDLESFLSPSTSLGRSEADLTSTATRTTGETEYFMTLMLWASSQSEIVPCLRRY